MMTNPPFLSKSIDYLGSLGARLRDLQGYATLAHELIQNADDAPASWMSFNIDTRLDALILDNDGVVNHCGNVEAPECPWSSDGTHNHKCDFHRLRSTDSGDKRRQEGATGAFGIGFISVYQLTDRPELISAGRHWKLHEEESEDKRIEVCRDCPQCSELGLPGTRFIFPFARGDQSQLRRALKADPVPKDVTARLLRELEQSLPVAMLFLKNLNTIEIQVNGVPRRKFERERESDVVIISQGSADKNRVFRLLQGNFQKEAADLRLQHPGRIEEKKSSDVVVALPDEMLKAGLLCACLPTEQVRGLPFHVNADFFPSNDRKRIILDDDYQSQWNRAALLAASRTVAEAVPRLTKMLGAEHFWHLVSTLNDLARTSRRDNSDSVWAMFWSALVTVLRREAVVLTTFGNWTTADSGVTILEHREEADNIHVLQGLGIDLVSEDLRPYQPILRSIGVPLFNIETLCSAMTANGLNRTVRLDDLPPCLRTDFGRGALWAEVNVLLRPQDGIPRAKSADQDRLRTISLAPTIDKKLRPCKDTFRTDARATVSLFESLGLNIPFLDGTEATFEPLSTLCNEFDAKSAVHSLEKGSSVTFEQRWKEGAFSAQELITWFANQSEQIVNDADTRRRLANLSIYPSSSQLRPLTELVLPGDFTDTLGLAKLVDEDALGGQHEFLLKLGVQKLNFRTYVLTYLSQALDDEKLDPTKRQEAITHLAKRLSELRGDDEVRDRLSSVRLVRCTDEEYRRADECYFPIGFVQEVLETDAFFVDLLDENELSVRELLEWLGVASVPRLRDVVQIVHSIVAGPCSETTVARIQKIVAHLGESFENLQEISELVPLQDIEWLPARGDTTQWHHPSSLYAPNRRQLFESQARILDVPRTDRRFLEFLSVRIDPTSDLVVRHLLHCSEQEKPVNSEVYRFLNVHADDPAVQKLKSTRCLWLGDAYRFPEHVFWVEHPFGKYRWRLGEGLQGYERLLDKVGVVTRPPNHEDALGVLHEISTEFGDANRPLGDEENEVVMQCWQMCQGALERGTLSEQSLGDLSGIKCIPNKDRVLYPPEWLFFENQGLEAKFGEFLEKNVVPRQPMVERAFLAAGVQPLRTAVEVILLRKENPENDFNTVLRLRERKTEIARVFFGSHMVSEDLESTLDRLDRLKCKSATLLEFQFALNAFRRYLESQPETGAALYDPDEHLLWTTYLDGQDSRAPLARELASALCPEEDPGPFAAGLKEVLVAGTRIEAAKALDELGFVQVDTSVVGTPANQEAVQQLGTDSPLIDREPALPASEGDVHQEMSPEDEHEILTINDTMAQPDTSPSQSVSSPEVSGQTGTYDVGRSGTNEQLGGPTSRAVKSATNERRRARPRGRQEFISYIGVRHDDESGPDHLPLQERMDLEEKSINLILSKEPELKRTPPNNPGFDLTETDPQGQSIKWVEVKATKTTLNDNPVALTSTQFKFAQKHGEAYWLYIVEYAADPEHAQIIKIRDPAGKAQRFTFDHGWRAISEDT